MPLSVEATSAIRRSVCNEASALELIAAFNSSSGSLPQALDTTNSPTFVTETLTGGETVATTLGVAGATTLGSTLAVTGAASLGSTLAVTGAATLSSTLAVTGASTLTGNTAVAGTLAVTGTSTFTGATTHTADATFNGHVLLATGKVVKVNNIQVVGAQQAVIPPITTTYTTGSAPTTGTTQTIANAATPTVVELLQYIANVEARVSAMNVLLKAHGLEASA